ncbi:phage tail tape measure protein [Henriciella sp.]|uniref:phage tail tape measure protein n=1 Tax=Henriciella sp. TaxID=1968823 RepID=UPI000C0D8F9E|nr:phage tail tape measure protein [Henriciella sp.]PHR83097.1 MAG: phage tail tape measure protein [Henriciella sp.]
MEIASLGLRIDSQDVDKGTRSLERFERQSSRTEAAAARLGQAATRAVAGFVAIGVASIGFSTATDRAREFNAAIAEVSTLLPAVPSEIDAITASSRALVEQYGGSATAQAKAFYQAISAGAGDAAASAELLDTANRVAIGGITQVTTAVDVLTTAQNAYAASGLRAEDAADALFVGMKAGKTTIDELSNSLGRAIPQATAVGFEFHELVAATAALTTQGQDTKLAVTGLSGIMTQLLKPSSQAVELANQLGIEFTATKAATMGLAGFMEYLVEKTDGSQEALATLFGSVESLRAVFSLAGQGGVKFNEILDQMEGRAGAANEAYEKMASSLDQRLNVAMSKFGNMALTAGEASLNVLVPAMEGALEVTGFLSDNMDVLTTAGAASAVVFGGPMVASFMASSTAAKIFTASVATLRAGITLLLGPVGLGIAAVGALTAILVQQGREADRRAAELESYAAAADEAREAARAAQGRLSAFRDRIGETGDEAREASGLVDMLAGSIDRLSDASLAGMFDRALGVLDPYKTILEDIRDEQSLVGMEGAALAEAQETKARELADATIQQQAALTQLNEATAEQARLEAELNRVRYTVEEGRVTRELEAQNQIVADLTTTWSKWSAVVSGLMDINVDDWAGDTFREQERAAEAAAEAVQDTITGLREELALTRETDDTQRAILENLQAAGLAANDNSAAAREIRDLTRQKLEAEKALEAAKAAGDTIEDLEIEVDQLQRLTGALRLGEEAHYAVSRAIAVEDLIRKNGLEGMDDEIARITELVNRRADLQRTYDGMSQDFDAANDNGITETEATSRRESFDDLNRELTLGIDNPLLRLERDYRQQLEIVEEYEALKTHEVEKAAEARALIEDQYLRAQRDIMLGTYSEIFGDVASIMRDSVGEQSAAYKLMIAAQQGFVIASATLNIAKALSEALALPFPLNLAEWAKVTAYGAQIMSSIQTVTDSFAVGGYTGPGGVNDPAGVVHKGEVVWSQQDVARYGGWQNVDAMRRGQAPANDNRGGGQAPQIQIINNAPGVQVRKEGSEMSPKFIIEEATRQAVAAIADDLSGGGGPISEIGENKLGWNRAAGAR